ncbi:hypothetical protein AAFF_G00393260 [Aldrovandia affinis]|uniref:Uncharacterized protein n=1 Tax=Aldrovandia affinis TaxID=143900 RepID=A0AAD7WKT3_9TELE|nr:hypothetical protein AAFF_G00393260 [Aldrovandia affinis]
MDSLRSLCEESLRRTGSRMRASAGRDPGGGGVGDEHMACALQQQHGGGVAMRSDAGRQKGGEGVRNVEGRAMA